MKSGKPLVLVVNRRGTVKHSSAGGQVRQRAQLCLVAADGEVLRGIAPVATQGPPAAHRRPRCPPSRPFGQRVVQAANDVAVLAIALLSGLRPRA